MSERMQSVESLTVLHDGEAGVQGGLSQLVNLESTLLKAVEEGKARAIDSLIKDITALYKDLPVNEAPKKKLSTSSPELEQPTGEAISAELKPTVVQEGPPSPKPKKQEHKAPEEKTPVEKPQEPQAPKPEEIVEDEAPKPPSESESLPLEPISSQASNKEIQKYVDALPQDFKDFMEETFRAKYVNVRKVDPKVLLPGKGAVLRRLRTVKRQVSFP